MTEDQIERRVERHMDHLDRVLLSGDMSQRDYDLAVRELNQWAEAQHLIARAAERRRAERLRPCAVCGRTKPEGDCCINAGV